MVSLPLPGLNDSGSVPHLQNGRNDGTYLVGLLGGLNEFL